MAKWGEIKCTNCTALEERLEAAQRDAKEAEAYAAELEAKLAKALDGLREAENAPWPDHHVPQFRHAMDVIGTTLAELTSSEAANGEAKGGKDE